MCFFSLPGRKKSRGASDLRRNGTRKLPAGAARRPLLFRRGGSEILPEGPGKERLKGILIQLLDGMLEWQDSASGMWYNVVNRGPELEGNRTETSVTCMMAYTLVKVWNGRYAPGDHYLEKGLEAFHAVIRDKAEVRDGEIHIRDIYLKSGVGDTDEYYCREGYMTDEAKGSAALIMAAAEIEKAVAAHTGE